MAMDRKNNHTRSPLVKSYLTFNDKNVDSVISQVSSSRDLRDCVYSAKASPTNNVYDRSPYSPGTYENTRGYSGLPMIFKDIIYACRTSYFSIGTVRNVVDLMTDFVCEDIKIVHTDKKEEAFFKLWSEKINLYEVIVEFARHLLTDANVVVRRSTAKLSSPVGEQWQEEMDAQAKPDIKLYKTKREVNKREIPIKYTFLNVAALHWIDEDFGKITGQKRLAFRVSPALLSRISSENALTSQLTSGLNSDDFEALKKSGSLALDMSKIYFASMKKDSWQDWAIPYIYSILSDIQYKLKLKQLDVAAADGSMNPIRLWKLGDHKEKILPAAGAINRLAEILENNPGGGPVDIIWDSMIEMQEYYPPIDKILGPNKYEQVDRDILIGLGIPEVLLGGKGANFSNSFIQLKTIVERIKYVRHQIKNWLQQEIKLLCKGMEIETLPIIKFGNINLEDENVTKKLITDLLDRNIISVETVLDYYGSDFEIEIERKKREKKILEDNDIEVKSPLQGEEDPIALNGRPPKTPELKRSQRKPKPKRSMASVLPDIIGKVDKIDKIVTDLYMESNDIANARKLTNEHTKEIEALRRGVLGQIDVNQDIQEESVIAILDNFNYNHQFEEHLQHIISDCSVYKNRSPSLPEKKYVEAVALATYGLEE